MNAKQIIFHDAARAKIRQGVDALAEAVKVTLGPRGRTVILERDFGPPQIVNSGVLVAKSIELEDRFENMGAQLLALQNAASIASLILTTDCMIAALPAPNKADAGLGAGAMPSGL